MHARGEGRSPHKCKHRVSHGPGPQVEVEDGPANTDDPATAQGFDWKQLQLFEREAKALESLSHSGIPRYIDYFEVDTTEDRGFFLVQVASQTCAPRPWSTFLNPGLMIAATPHTHAPLPLSICFSSGWLT